MPEVADLLKDMKIKTYDMSSISNKVKSARDRAMRFNMHSKIAEYNLNMIVSPDNNEKYLIDERNADGRSHEKLKVLNGIPDFSIFSKYNSKEKNEQANYHDNEHSNETFDEIVLRPFNYNKLHAKIWLDQLEKFTPIIESYFNIKFNQVTLLNCGCGGGFEAQFFAEQGAKVTGFDISQLRAEAAATRFALNNLEGFFYRGDSAVLPYPENSFDFVVFHDSLHHVPIEEIPIAVREACRVSKLGVVLFEAHDSLFRMLLESIGLSKSIESSGNYVFRFRKSLVKFWCIKYNMEFLLYSINFIKKEHRPKYYKIPIVGKFLYLALRMFGFILRPLGNEAVILMGKVQSKQQ